MRGERILARRAGDYDPIGSMVGLAQPMIGHLLAIGLAEQGVANGQKGTIGYRLSPLGATAFSRAVIRARWTFSGRQQRL